jgi:hypothetical protein
MFDRCLKHLDSICRIRGWCLQLEWIDPSRNEDNFVATESRRGLERKGEMAAMRGIEGTTKDQNGPAAGLSTSSNPAVARSRTVGRSQLQFAEGFAKGEEPGSCLSRKCSESLEQRGALEQLDRDHEDPRPPQMVDEAIK